MDRRQFLGAAVAAAAAPAAAAPGWARGKARWRLNDGSIVAFHFNLPAGREAVRALAHHFDVAHRARGYPGIRSFAVELVG